MRITVVGKIITGFVLFGVLLLITNVTSYWGLSDIRKSARLVVDEKNAGAVTNVDCTDSVAGTGEDLH